MPNKKAAPALTAIPKPPSRAAGKGEPPKTSSDTVSGNQNTSAPATGKLVDLGFKVDPEYRRNYRQFCADQDDAQVAVFKEAMADYMRKKGWPTIIE